jgi:hypothetical protein
MVQGCHRFHGFHGFDRFDRFDRFASDVSWTHPDAAALAGLRTLPHTVAGHHQLIRRLRDQLFCVTVGAPSRRSAR